MPLSWELPLFLFLFLTYGSINLPICQASRNLFMRPPTSYDVHFRRQSNGQHFSFLLGNSTLVREIFHIMCTDAFLIFQLMGVILPRILFKSPNLIDFQLLQNRSVHRGLFDIVANRLQCYPTCQTCCSSAVSTSEPTLNVHK